MKHEGILFCMVGNLFSGKSVTLVLNERKKEIKIRHRIYIT